MQKTTIKYRQGALYTEIGYHTLMIFVVSAILFPRPELIRNLFINPQLLFIALFLIILGLANLYYLIRAIAKWQLLSGRDFVVAEFDSMGYRFVAGFNTVEGTWGDLKETKMIIIRRRYNRHKYWIRFYKTGESPNFFSDFFLVGYTKVNGWDIEKESLTEVISQYSGKEVVK